MDRPVLILGAGYVGRVLHGLAARRGRSVLATSRSPEARLRDLPAGQRLSFDLLRPETWARLPDQADVLWCFPARPLDAVVALAAQRLGSCRLVVLGSTSAYQGIAPAVPGDDPIIDETAPVNLTLPRVQGEEHLRCRHGAIVLRVAGIYGPGRNPLDWIRRGRVGPSRRHVNLVHVEDLAAICLLALERGHPGETYLVSDGTPRRWSEICAVARRRFGVQTPGRPTEDRPGKRVSHAKLIAELGHGFRWPDLYAALEDLEAKRGHEPGAGGGEGAAHPRRNQMSVRPTVRLLNMWARMPGSRLPVRS